MAKLEEAERQRRIQEEKKEIKKEEEQTKFESEISRMVTKQLEEEEKQRRYVTELSRVTFKLLTHGSFRISEELQAKFQAGIDSELNRRKTWILEEQERRRRMMQAKQHSQHFDELMDLVHTVNTMVSRKIKHQQQKQQTGADVPAVSEKL